MKTITYQTSEPQTVIVSLVMGYGHTRDINGPLTSERAVASYLRLDRFPDQSQINRYLTRLNPENKRPNKCQ